MIARSFPTQCFNLSVKLNDRIIVYGNIPNNLSYRVFIPHLLRLARVNSILSGFKTSVTELIGKLIAQGFEVALLRNKFVKFYKSNLNIWGKYGSNIYDECIEMFQSSNGIL